MFEHNHCHIDFKYPDIFSYHERIMNLDEINIILMSFQDKHNCQGVINSARVLIITNTHAKTPGGFVCLNLSLDKSLGIEQPGETIISLSS
jgi:hypothetical protein